MNNGEHGMMWIEFLAMGTLLKFKCTDRILMTDDMWTSPSSYLQNYLYQSNL